MHLTQVWHLVDPEVWAGAMTAGRYAPPSLAAEGFVHCSFTAQVAGSANRHCAGAERLVALRIDAAVVAEHLVVEDSYGSGTAYPHVYAPLDPAWVVAVRPLTRDPAGAWTFSPGDEAAAG